MKIPPSFQTVTMSLYPSLETRQRAKHPMESRLESLDLWTRRFNAMGGLGMRRFVLRLDGLSKLERVFEGHSVHVFEVTPHRDPQGNSCRPDVGISLR